MASCAGDRSIGVRMIRQDLRGCVTNEQSARLFEHAFGIRQPGAPDAERQGIEKVPKLHGDNKRAASREPSGTRERPLAQDAQAGRPERIVAYLKRCASFLPYRKTLGRRQLNRE